MALMDNAVDAVPNISIITQIELICWNTDDATTENVKSFIADSVIMDISPDVILHCVTPRKGKKINTPDAIIAATALPMAIVAEESVILVLCPDKILN
jgi:uncharacterized membrane protein